MLPRTPITIPLRKCLLSPSIIIKRWECSICHKNYEECPHEAGKKYGKEICRTIARDIEIREISVVDKPTDPKCRIIDLLLVYEEKGRKVYEWHGFKPNNENDHLKNIQRAYENGLIPEKAAFYFGRFFSINTVGHISYYSD
ncbi:hypothetical protein DRO64_10025 [Candidatus Bathyarchaeota archaeon]|nr:MAG: hypothetical protein DRO64_10025 [Candidatus Bathyarchaeota archaeon]